MANASNTVQERVSLVKLNEKVAVWLSKHPYFKVYSMGKDLGIPPSSLHQQLSGSRIEKERLLKIVQILKKYGFKW